MSHFTIPVSFNTVTLSGIIDSSTYHLRGVKDHPAKPLNIGHLFKVRSMLALFASPLIRDAILGLLLAAMLAGAYGYYRWSQAELTVLRDHVVLVQQQADSLLVAKTKLDADIAVIKAAQDGAGMAIARARTQAARDSRAIRAGQPVLPPGAPSDPRDLQTRLNADQAATLQILEALSQ
jgi:hypothetical protein